MPELQHSLGLWGFEGKSFARSISARPPAPIVRQLVGRPRGPISCQAEGRKASDSAQHSEVPAALQFSSSDNARMHTQSNVQQDHRRLHKGDAIAGRYQVLEVLGKQGSTTMCIARGPDGKKVLIKALSLQSMANWDELEAFERESRALRAVSQSNAAFPRFIEVFEEDHQDRTFYIIQEHVEGPTLAQRLAQGWRASPATLQRLSTQLLQGLQALEQANGGPIAHGAITPDHIVLRQTTEGLQACIVGFSAAEQLPGVSAEVASSLPEDLQSAQQDAAMNETSTDPAANSSSSSSGSSSWDVEVDVGMGLPSNATHQQSSASFALEAQPVLAALSEALTTSTEYAAPEALGGEARMGVSDAYSVGAVLAAAAAGGRPSFSWAGQWMVPGNLQGTRLAAVIQGLLRKDWRQRLTSGQALDVLAGQPMPAMPAAQCTAAPRPGIQGLAQSVLQLGRDARSQANAAFRGQRQEPTGAIAKQSQPQGLGLPAAALGLVMASTLVLGPTAPLFLFSVLPFLAAGSRGPGLAIVGSPYPARSSMGFQTFPRGVVSPMQQQQMLRMMLAQQAQQQQIRSAVYMQRQRQLQRLRNQQMWGGFF